MRKMQQAKYLAERDNIEWFSDEESKKIQNAVFKTAMEPALQKMTKMSDGRAANIKKFGYDTKSFHHCMRLLFFAEDYMRGKPYEECLTRGDNDTLTNWLIKAKTGELGFSLEKANDCINRMMANVEPQVDYFKNRMGNIVDGAIEKTIDDIVTEIIKRSIGA